MDDSISPVRLREQGDAGIARPSSSLSEVGANATKAEGETDDHRCYAYKHPTDECTRPKQITDTTERCLGW